MTDDPFRIDFSDPSDDVDPGEIRRRLTAAAAHDDDDAEATIIGSALGLDLGPAFSSMPPRDALRASESDQGEQGGGEGR